MFPAHFFVVLCAPGHRPFSRKRLEGLKWSAQGGLMKVPSVSIETITDFLAQKRIAVVGMSRDPASFSVAVAKELMKRGYDVVPVNPQTAELLGRRCFANVKEIQPPVDAALLMTTPDVTENVVVDCAEAGVRRVWMHRAGGEGAVNAEAIEFCRAHGIAVVPGQCPLMFLPETQSFHRFHGWVRKITGRYPGHAAAA